MFLFKTTLLDLDHVDVSLRHHKPIRPLNLSFTSKSQNLKSRLYAMGDEEEEFLEIWGITKSWS